MMDNLPRYPSQQARRAAEEALRDIETNNARVDSDIYTLAQHMEAFVADRIAALEAALQRIVQWSEAYPLDIFAEPDWKKARALLEAGGITMDAVSAHCMRHVVEGVGKIARAALDKDTGQ